MELGAPGQEMKKLLASNKKEIPSTMLEYAETFRATEITCDEWAKQEWQRPADGARGVKHLIEQHYPDFHDRMRRLAYLMIRVAPLLATPGYTTEAEYRDHLQDEMRKLLPFLTEPVRQDVAAALLVVHATHKDDAYIEDPRLISID
jgi:hypothetical protein